MLVYIKLNSPLCPFVVNYVLRLTTKGHKVRTKLYKGNIFTLNFSFICFTFRYPIRNNTVTR